MAFTFSGEALAQCTKDTECKGDRICVEGKCVSPAAPAPTTTTTTPVTTPTPAVTTPAPTPDQPPSQTPAPTTPAPTTTPPAAPAATPPPNPAMNKVRGPFDVQLTVGLYGSDFNNIIGGAEALAGVGLPVGDGGALQVVGGVNLLYPGNFVGVLGAGYRWRRDEVNEVLWSRVALAVLPAVNAYGTFLSWQLRGDVHGHLFGSPNLFAITYAVNLAEYAGNWGVSQQLSFGVAF